MQEPSTPAGANAFVAADASRLFGASEEGVVFFDAELRCLHANGAAIRLFSLRGDGPGGADFPVQLLGAVAESELSRVVRERRSAQFAYFCAATRRFFEVYATPVAAGGAAAFFRDAHSGDEQFLTALAHELRSPLAPLRTSLEILRREVGPEVKEQARSIMSRQLEQMARLIDDLSDYCRLGSATTDLRNERTALAELLAEAVELAQRSGETGRGRVTVELPDAPVDLSIDRRRIAQALSDLLDAAAKYGPPGGEIRLCARVEGLVVVVSIRRAATASERDYPQAAASVRLAFARRLMELHGGAFRTAGAGDGSEFVVRLPVAAAGDPPRGAGSEPDRLLVEPLDRGAAPGSGGEHASPNSACLAGASSAAAASAMPRKVLVVDDSPLMLESAVAILESRGYEVRTAADGVEALAVVADWRPSLVLLDMHMPRLGGIDTARRLRVDHPPSTMGLLMMSGVTLDEAWLSHARSAGFDDCLDKTADPEVWLASLERLAASVDAA